MRADVRASSRDQGNADVVVTATVTPVDSAGAAQSKRRTLFLCLLGAILLAGPRRRGAARPLRPKTPSTSPPTPIRARRPSESTTSATQPSTIDRVAEHDIGPHHQQHGQAEGDDEHHHQAQVDHDHDGTQGRREGRRHPVAAPKPAPAAVAPPPAGSGATRRRGRVPGVRAPTRVRVATTRSSRRTGSGTAPTK